MTRTTIAIVIILTRYFELSSSVSIRTKNVNYHDLEVIITVKTGLKETRIKCLPIIKLSISHTTTVNTAPTLIMIHTRLYFWTKTGNVKWYIKGYWQVIPSYEVQPSINCIEHRWASCWFETKSLPLIKSIAVWLTPALHSATLALQITTRANTFQSKMIQTTIANAIDVYTRSIVRVNRWGWIEASESLIKMGRL